MQLTAGTLVFWQTKLKFRASFLRWRISVDGPRHLEARPGESATPLSDPNHVFANRNEAAPRWPQLVAPSHFAAMDRFVKQLFRVPSNFFWKIHEQRAVFSR